MPKSKLSVVPIMPGNKVCKPFLLEVMVFSPEVGYKFKVIVERSCTPEADEIWKLVFDLYQVKNGQETLVVHVSYTTGTPVEQRVVQAMATDGVKHSQAKVLTDEVHTAAKAIEGDPAPSPAKKKKLHDSIQKVVSLEM